jgi:hypothetical protein
VTKPASGVILIEVNNAVVIPPTGQELLVYDVAPILNAETPVGKLKYLMFAKVLVNSRTLHASQHSDGILRSVSYPSVITFNKLKQGCLGS